LNTRRKYGKIVKLILREFTTWNYLIIYKKMNPDQKKRRDELKWSALLKKNYPVRRREKNWIKKDILVCILYSREANFDIPALEKHTYQSFVSKSNQCSQRLNQQNLVEIKRSYKAGSLGEVREIDLNRNIRIILRKCRQGITSF
jgi:hypothetical protein